MQLLAMEQRQLLVGLKAVIDEPMKQTPWNQLTAVPLHKGSLGSNGQRLGQEHMAIEALTHQGNEQLTSRERSGVGADLADGSLGIPIG